MKKILAFIGCLFVSTMAFANMELDINYYGAFADKTNVDSDWGDLTIDQGSAAGCEEDFNFFFGHGAGNFDIGFGLFAAIDSFTEMDVEDTNLDCNYGFNFAIGAGPVFRYTINNVQSIYARPSIGYDFRIAEAEPVTGIKDTIADYSVLFDLNLGGRTWFLNKTGFHFGVDYGCNLDFMFAGSGYVGIDDDSDYESSTSVTNYYDISDRFAAKIYLGVCFNFGDRGIDR